MPTSDRVRLSVPAEAAWLRLARLTVAAVAGRLGFDLDAIDDVQIAVDELCRLLLGEAEGRTLVIECTIAAGHLEVAGATDGPGGQPEAPDELARQILGAVVDTYAYEHTPLPHFSFVKRSVPPPR